MSVVGEEKALAPEGEAGGEMLKRGGDWQSVEDLAKVIGMGCSHWFGNHRNQCDANKTMVHKTINFVSNQSLTARSAKPLQRKSPHMVMCCALFMKEPPSQQPVTTWTMR